MRMVVLYGPPGVGKLTVATQLAARTGFRLFHNHETFHLVTSIFPPFTPAWSRLVRELRIVVMEAVAREGVDLVITLAPPNSSPEMVETIRTILQPVQAAGGAIFYAHLTCNQDTLVQRVQQESRRAHGKLTDPQAVLDKFALDARLPFEPYLGLDTTDLSVAETAARIAEHFTLPLLAPGQWPAPPEPST